MVRPSEIRLRHASEAKLALTFFLLASAAILLTRFNGGVALLWVANAPLIMHLSRQRTAAHWRLALAWSAPASVAASMLFGPVLWAAPSFGLASIIESVVAALLLRFCLGDRDHFGSTRSIIIFIAVAGMIGPASGALIGATTALFALHRPWAATFVDWVVGRGLGTLTAAPIVALLVTGERRALIRHLVPQLWGEGGALLAGVAITTAAVFWQERLPLLFLPALPILLATFKLGRPGAALSIMLVALIGGIATASGHGPVMMTRLSRVGQLQFFQVYLAATFLMSLPIAGALGQREKLMLAVRENNRLFEMAGGLASVGHWRIDLMTSDLVWSDEVFRIHGREPGGAPRLEEAFAYYHPDDRDRVEAIVNDAIVDRCAFAFAARLIRDDGSTRHVVAQGQIELNESGTALAIFGVLQDVTERELAAQSLRDSEARFRLITEQASDMIALIALDGTCLFMSPASRTILGFSPEAMVGTRPIDRAHEDDRSSIEHYRAELRAGDTAVSSLRFRMRRADGDFAWLEASSRVADLGDSQCIVTVWRDVSDQVAIEAELKAAKAAAEAATIAKAGFLANMSHEIRTPMNGVIGFAELLLTSELTDQQRRDAGLIADSGRALMKLLNDILDLSKIEAGQLDVVDEPFDLPHALRACGKLLGPSAAGKRISLVVTVADDVPRFVRGDALRVRQIVLNLLGNAIKFTEHGGVTLVANVVPIDGEQRLAIAVSDSGIGIAPERQETIFREFVQADHSITRRYGGSGLGLSISNRLAHLMGGRIDLESRPGEGTVVTLQLPAVAADEAAANPKPPVTGTTTRRAGRAARVLLAEDHEVNQLLVCAMLARDGHHVTVVTDGQQAVEAVRRSNADGSRFDLVLMDMQMPVMDGLAATRAIRAGELPGGRRLPVIALTANAFASDLEACHAAGMDDHIAKPVCIDTLLLAVDRWTAAADPQGAPGGPPAVDLPAPARKAAFRPSAAARARYAEHRARTFEHVDALIRRGAFAGQELEAVAELLHKLAGTAGMFGERDLGDRASEFEEGLRVWPAADRAARIAAAAERLREAA